MEQEIDLREYIAVLFKRKVWIVSLAVLAAVGAAVVSLLIPPTYRATALVVVTKPQYKMQFDPNFEPLPGNVQPPYKAYPLLAESDEVVAALIDDLGDTLPAEDQTVSALGSKLTSQNGGDPSVIRLSVEDSDPRRAAQIANAWANRFVQVANELYAQDTDELAFFLEQQNQAQAQLAQAEQALIDFQARNPATLLETQLLHMHATLTADLQAVHSMETIIQDARSLRDRLQMQAISDNASPSDELTLLLIEVKALGHGGAAIQVEFSTLQDLQDKTVGDQIAFLDALILVLESRLAQLEEQARSWEPEILALQEASQKALTEQDQLTTAHELARETFVSLSRKVTEARIAAQDTMGDVRTASLATPPLKPISPRKAFNVAIAGALGLLVGIVAVLGVEYWQQGKQ
jgi:uncharacterized protein involved in exopolysaccharide biosynthesis